MSYLELLAKLGVGSAHPGGFSLTKRILKNEQIQPGSTVLDVGCGTGKTASFLTTIYGCKVEGVDIHPVMIKKAKERFLKEKLNIPVTKGNAEQLPYQTETFDFVVAESITLFTDMSQAIPEYARVLKKNGVLLALEITAEPTLSKAVQKEISSVYNIKRIPTEEEWLQAFRSGGFSKVTVTEKGGVEPPTPNLDEEESEFSPSIYIDPHLFTSFQHHQEIIQKNKKQLGYRVFRAVL
ncbi:class I SAM-dependent methyltransferase [Halalkalibacterium ligniniphilum]|uniref:class I SAM-dependent methyltransferase n=1 Tax=Halalkalibacterium ligniniphilum TaxID=1134413 RepID=UPI00034D4056|nr:class I SAM-dependent methyltransferase [Halalkalibacterium ligniniphilum]